MKLPFYLNLTLFVFIKKIFVDKKIIFKFQAMNRWYGNWIVWRFYGHTYPDW